MAHARDATGAVGWIEFSPDGKRIATAGLDQTVRLWDAASGDPLQTFKGHSQSVVALAWSPDGKLIASGSRHAKDPFGEVKVWDVATGKDLHTFSEGKGIKRVTFTPDSGRVIYAFLGPPAGVRVRDAQTGAEVALLEKINISNGGLVTPDGIRLYVGTNQVWDLKKGSGPTTTAYYSPKSFLALSPDAKQVATVGGNLLTFWDNTTSKPVYGATGAANNYRALSVSADGKKVFTATSSALFVWDIPPGKDPTQPVKNVPGHVFSPDGKRLARTPKTKGKVTLGDAVSGKDTISLPDDFFPSIPPVFSPDGDRLATAELGEKGTSRIRIWHSVTGKEMVSFPTTGHAYPVARLAWSPDRKRLATLASDGARVWDAETGKQIQSLPATSSGLDPVFTPDGTGLALPDNYMIKIWDVESGAGRISLECPRSAGACTCVAFRHDGKEAVSSFSGGVVRVWETVTGKTLHEWTLLGPVSQVAYTPDSRHVVTANADGTLYVFRLGSLAK